MKTINAVREKKSYDDYLKLEEGEPCQLIDGMFVMSPSPSVPHQRVLLKIEIKLFSLEKKGLGKLLHAPMDVYFSDTDVYQPDIMFISNERFGIIGEKNIQGAPDLIVEALSPATGYYDLRHKKKVYESAGVREYWIVDPQEKSIEVYENGPSGFTLYESAGAEGRAASSIFPDFYLEASEVFG